MAKGGKGSGGDKNDGGTPMDDYRADTGKMDSPWFSGKEDGWGRKLMKSAPSVSGMDDQGDGIRDGTSGANDYAGAGTAPGGRKT